MNPCANKCSEFKNGEQCFFCLINETVNQGVYSMHRTEHRINTNDMVDDAHIENKMLHEAASTHLKNQMHFKKLYDALVEQLYPYALDLNEPIDGYPKEYVDGYNRARECVHYNLLEMMESDEEYIRAQCDMLGGGEA